MQSRSPMLREDASMNHDDSDLPLDLIVRTTLDPQGQRRETFHVDCPRQDHLVGTGECDSCDRRYGARLDAHGQPNVLCELPRRKHHAAAADAPVSSLIGKSLECVTIDVTSDAAASLLVERQLDALAVVDRDGRPLGEVSRADALRAPPGTRVADLVHSGNAQVRDDDTIASAAAKMVAEGLQRVPVVSHEGTVVGVVSALDLLGLLTREGGSGPAHAAEHAMPVPRARREASLRGATIVIIDADTSVTDPLRDRLSELGFLVEVANTGPAGLALVRRHEPAVVVVDTNIPGMPGTDVLRRIRNTPGAEDAGIVLVAKKGDEVDRIVGFELGADDYVHTPTSARELALRVRALARRTVLVSAAPARTAPAHPPRALGPGETTWRLKWRGLEIDPSRHRVYADGQPLSLRRMEYKFLMLLMEQPGRVLTRTFIRNEVWGDEEDVSPRTIDTHVRRLRAALGVYQDAIETVHGFGYRLREP